LLGLGAELGGAIHVHAFLKNSSPE
jgi:hypothetical protein